MGRMGRRKELLEFVEDMVELGAYSIREHIPGTDEALARDVAIDIANALCHRHLKRTFYVPADYEPRLMRRDEELMAALAMDSATSRRYSAGRAPMMTPSTVAIVASSKVAGKKCRRSDSTGWDVMTDWPKSPDNSFFR